MIHVFISLSGSVNKSHVGDAVPHDSGSATVEIVVIAVSTMAVAVFAGVSTKCRSILHSAILFLMLR